MEEAATGMTEQAGFGAIIGGAVASAVASKILEKAEDEITPADEQLQIPVPSDADSESVTTSKAEEEKAKLVGVKGRDVLRVHEVEPLPNLIGFTRELTQMAEASDWNNDYFAMLFFRSSNMSVGMSRIYETAREVFSVSEPMYKVLDILQYHRTLEANPKFPYQESFKTVHAYNLTGDKADFKEQFISEMQRAYGALPETMRYGLWKSDAKIGLGDDYTSISREDMTSHVVRLTTSGLLGIATRIEALYRGFRGNKKAMSLPQHLYQKQITPIKDKAPKVDYVVIDDMYVKVAEPISAADENVKADDIGKLDLRHKKINLHEYMIENGGSEYMHHTDALAEIGNVTVSEDNEWLDVLDNVNIFVKAGLDPMTYMNTLAYPRGCAIYAIVKHWKKSAGQANLSEKMIDELFA